MAQLSIRLDPSRPFRLRAYSADGTPLRTPEESEAVASAAQEVARADSTIIRAGPEAARADQGARDRTRLAEEPAALQAELQRLRSVTST